MDLITVKEVPFTVIDPFSTVTFPSESSYEKPKTQDPSTSSMSLQTPT